MYKRLRFVYLFFLIQLQPKNNNNVSLSPHSTTSIHIPQFHSTLLHSTWTLLVLYTVCRRSTVVVHSSLKSLLFYHYFTISVMWSDSDSNTRIGSVRPKSIIRKRARAPIAILLFCTNTSTIGKALMDRAERTPPKNRKNFTREKKTVSKNLYTHTVVVGEYNDDDDDERKIYRFAKKLNFARPQRTNVLSK